jgi:thiamine biosynthesis lipoprotein
MAASDQPTRREFLQGRAAADALATALGTPEADRSEELSLLAPRSSHLISVRRQAMACEFEVQLAARHDDAMEHVLEALDLVEALEDQMTVYRDDSEVIRINRRAAEGPVPVESRLFALFQLAERLYRETHRAFDITSGPLSDVWGFSRRAGRWPEEEALTTALDRVGMDQVALDETAQSIAFRRPGVAVNLNSIGKGYALDRVAELLAERGVSDFLLHGGRSSVLARGDAPGAAGWSIGLRHPLRPEQRLGEIVLRDEALATSGSGTQYFEHEGRRYGHVIDPRTGRPAEGVYTATVVAPTAAEADALSTAFYVMRPPEVERFCAARPDVSAVLVCPAESEGSVRLCTFGLEEGRWRPPGEEGFA